MALMVSDVLDRAQLNTLYMPFRNEIPLTEVALGGAIELVRNADRADGPTAHRSDAGVWRDAPNDARH